MESMVVINMMMIRVIILDKAIVGINKKKDYATFATFKGTQC